MNEIISQNTPALSTFRKALFANVNTGRLSVCHFLGLTVAPLSFRFDHQKPDHLRIKIGSSAPTVGASYQVGIDLEQGPNRSSNTLRELALATLAESLIELNKKTIYGLSDIKELYTVAYQIPDGLLARAGYPEAETIRSEILNKHYVNPLKGWSLSTKSEGIINNVPTAPENLFQISDIVMSLSENRGKPPFSRRFADMCGLQEIKLYGYVRAVLLCDGLSEAREYLDQACRRYSENCQASS